MDDFGDYFRSSEDDSGVFWVVSGFYGDSDDCWDDTADADDDCSDFRDIYGDSRNKNRDFANDYGDFGANSVSSGRRLKGLQGMTSLVTPGAEWMTTLTLATID